MKRAKNLLEKISEVPLYSSSLIKQAIGVGYSNKTVLDAISGGIESNKKSEYKKLSTTKSSLMFGLCGDFIEKYEKLQKILSSKNLTDGTKLHNYLKAIDLPTDIDLDIFTRKLLQA